MIEDIGSEAVEALKHFFHEHELKLEEHFNEILQGGKAHIESQPYMIDCFICGDELEIETKRVDSDNDLWLEVIPCPTCLKEAANKQKRKTK